MNLKTAECPSCHSPFKYNPNNPVATCPYCGSTIVDEDYRSDHFTYNQNIHNHYYDEAEILKEKNRHKEEETSHSNFFIIFAVIFTLMMLAALSGAISTFFHETTKAQPYVTQAQITFNKAAMLPADSKSFSGDQLDEVVSRLKAAGFKNITKMPVYDLKWGVLNKENEVITVSIRGMENIKKGIYFLKKDEIIITYHAFKS